MPEQARTWNRRLMNATLGVEEEYHLVEPSGELARRSALAASASSGDLGDCVHAELQTTELEVATRVCTTLSELRTELIRGRVAAADAAAAAPSSRTRSPA
jgi:gamma-glutamyl:cysteine ligase YbdK (ATP-grasp superfamily)